MSASEPRDRSTDSISTNLLQRVKAHDQEAWQRLVRLYTPLVLQWCRHAQLGESDREDVSQEVFKVVARGIDRFRRDRPADTFCGWLRTITQSKIADYFRRRRPQQNGVGGTDAYRQLQEVPDRTAQSGDDALVDEDALLVRQALNLIEGEFEERTWQAFLRTTVAGRNAATVADELGMTPAAVRKAKSRVLYRLRVELLDIGYR